MNMKSISQAIGIIALMVSGSLFAQIQVPNTFQAGESAVAAEVNENFTTLSDAVNTNATAIQSLEGNQDLMGPHIAVIDANQIEVGVAVAVFPNVSNNYAVTWVDVAGNAVPVSVYKNVIGSVGGVYISYETADCTGIPMAQTFWAASSPNGMIRTGDYVVQQDGLSVSQIDTSTTVSITTMSRWRVNGIAGVWTAFCEAITPAVVDVHPLVPVGTLPVFTPPFSLAVVSN